MAELQRLGHFLAGAAARYVIGRIDQLDLAAVRFRVANSITSPSLRGVRFPLGRGRKRVRRGPKLGMRTRVRAPPDRVTTSWR